jgi:hypothetical protein
VLARVPQGVHLCVAVQAGNLPSVPCSYPNLAYVPPSFVIFWWRFLCHWPVLFHSLRGYRSYFDFGAICASFMSLAVTWQSCLPVAVTHGCDFSAENQWSCKMTAIAICSLTGCGLFWRTTFHSPPRFTRKVNLLIWIIFLCCSVGYLFTCYWTVCTVQVLMYIINCSFFASYHNLLISAQSLA